MRSREKALKRGTWFKGDQKADGWKKLIKTSRKVRKTSFKKAGRIGNPKRPTKATVVVC